MTTRVSAVPRINTRISLEQDYEVRDWTKSLGVTEAELTAAVKAVGNSAEKVREYLKNKK